MHTYYIYQMIGKDDNSLGALIHDVAHLLRTLIDREVGPYELTRVKWLALGILDRKDGLTQAELAEELELGAASVGRLVDRLEERGFIERRSDADDRRINRVYIKASARPTLNQLEEVARNVKTNALFGITKKNQKILIDDLTAIKNNLSKILIILLLVYT